MSRCDEGNKDKCGNEGFHLSFPIRNQLTGCANDEAWRGANRSRASVLPDAPTPTTNRPVVTMLAGKRTVSHSGSRIRFAIAHRLIAASRQWRTRTERDLENGMRKNGNSIEIDKDQDDKRKRRALRKPSCLVWSFAYRGSLGHLHPSLEARPIRLTPPMSLPHRQPSRQAVRKHLDLSEAKAAPPRGPLI
jgi:hypothetical protein